MLLGGPVSVVERFKPELTCELSTERGEGGGGVGCHKEVAINEASTVSIYSRRYKCNPPMALFSRFNYKVELKLQKDHTSREFEAKFTDKIMQHLKDEGPRTIYKPASHAIHKPCQDKN